VPLSDTQRVTVAKILGRAADEYVVLPLWDFHPYYRPQILAERKRRNLLQHEPEPIGDPEYH
jgi:hypothetical protein